jgi:hypothetical protein
MPRGFAILSCVGLGCLWRDLRCSWFKSYIVIKLYLYLLVRESHKPEYAYSSKRIEGSNDASVCL